MLSFSIPRLSLIMGGLATLLICQAIIITRHWHGRHTMDGLSGVQKVHENPTPRIGGIAVAIGLVFGWWFAPESVKVLLGPMLIASLPAFFSGIVEDLSKRGVVAERLFATIASGLLAWWLTGVSVTRLDLWGFDTILRFAPISILFTAVALGGVANAINIIDGFNGLASGAVLLSLATLGLIAFKAGDADCAKVCFVLGGAIAGFMLVNYPYGKIFLGDGGAYLLGFLLGWVAVLMTARNPGISPWAPLLACGYPILEVLFSMLRRTARTHNLGRPDRLHLHSLLWSRVTRQHFSRKNPTLQNALVMPLVLSYAIIPCLLAIYFRNNTAALMIGFIGCAALYMIVYMRLVHFRWIPKKFNL